MEDAAGEHGEEESLTESLEEEGEQQPMLLHAPEFWHLRDPPPLVYSQAHTCQV